MSTASASARNERYRATRRVTVIGGILDLVLGVLKLVFGYIASSQALIADGVHSLSDLATDFMVIWAAREASRAPDANHPYGHQRIETLATIVLGLALTAVAVGIAWDAARSALGGEVPTPGVAALLVAGFSVISKEAIFRYTMHIANQLDSELLRSNAWHSRSDALSSIVVIVGVAGTIMGYAYFDAAAAVIVAAMIIWVGGKMTWRGVQDLIDTGVHPNQVREIEQTVKDVDGVRDAHDLRTRRMGNEVYLDGHVLVNPKLSVSEGHRIGEAVRHRLRREYPEITDITIHIDAENDESYQRSAHLPLRADVDALLDEYWSPVPEAGLITRRIYHYLDGKLHVEVHLPLESFPDIEQAADAASRLRQAVAGDPRVARVDVLFH
ncbi:MAG TPA: cation diffusion facilitator family transporter [Arenicellales bacterium]|nr:cation diffusion facilitator family transporter [Arenicellales bacterium]